MLTNVTPCLHIREKHEHFVYKKGLLSPAPKQNQLQLRGKSRTSDIPPFQPLQKSALGCCCKNPAHESCASMCTDGT